MDRVYLLYQLLTNEEGKGLSPEELSEMRDYVNDGACPSLVQKVFTTIIDSVCDTDLNN